MVNWEKSQFENLTVNDNGCGIPDEFVAEVDKMFFVFNRYKVILCYL